MLLGYAGIIAWLPCRCLDNVLKNFDLMTVRSTPRVGEGSVTEEKPTGCLPCGFLIKLCLVGAGTGYMVLEEQQVAMAPGALMPGTHKYVIPDQERRGPSGASLRKYAFPVLRPCVFPPCHRSLCLRHHATDASVISASDQRGTVLCLSITAQNWKTPTDLPKDSRRGLFEQQRIWLLEALQIVQMQPLLPMDLNFVRKGCTCKPCAALDVKFSKKV